MKALDEFAYCRYYVTPQELVSDNFRIATNRELSRAVSINKALGHFPSEPGIRLTLRC
jgi:hypothetical protein